MYNFFRMLKGKQLKQLLLIILIGCSTVKAQVLTQQPIDTAGCIGGRSSLSVQVSDPAVYYQWQYYTASPTWQALDKAGFSTSRANETSLAIAPNGAVYALYIKYEHATNRSLAVNRFINGSWQALSSSLIGSEYLSSPAIAVSADGTLYIAFADGSNFGKASVYKHTHGQWVAVGKEAFTPVGVSNIRLAVDSMGQPYMCYTNGIEQEKAYVVKYSAGQWQGVGDGSVSDTSVNQLDFVLSEDAVPTICYSSSKDTLTEVKVRQFKNEQWQDLGNAQVEKGSLSQLRMVANQLGELYLAYLTEGRISIKTYTGITWENKGQPINDSSSAMELAIAPTGVPYLIYTDGPELKLSVQKFANTGWTLVGMPNFSAGTVYSPSGVIDQEGSITVIYRDVVHNDKATTMTFGQWLHVRDTNLYANTYSNRLLFKQINAALDSNQYRCVIDKDSIHLVSQSAIFTISYPYTLAVTTQHVACYGEKTGALTVVPSQAGDYRYSWSNGASTATVNQLSRGIYQVLVQDANDCRLEKNNLAITEPDALTLTLEAPAKSGRFPVSELGDTDGEIVAAVSGGLAPYTYLWSDASTSPYLTNLPVGMYRLTVTDAHNCTQTQSIALEAPDPIVFFDGMSPNNDGLNDALIIQGLEGYPINTLEIFTKDNNLLKTVENYSNTNPWDGTAGTAGNDMPVVDGVYCIKLTIKQHAKKPKVFKHFIELRR